ncbi:MAG TPA: PVC-type heme-binding CxxCH protein, partial [Candidatus Dormibacteraeota bacterium]|nr:PVC-type heme-binding CxxCH protein [Candidatus Dormibacteraeota bacterium]
MRRAVLLAWRVLLYASFIALPGSPLLSAETPIGALRGEALKDLLKPIPVKEPAEAIRCLQVIDGFSVEFVAHEPLVLDPVAAAIDENGLLYVAEDADYPYRPEEGKRPLGRIRVLRDRDGDGFYEESVLFADGLLWPAGVAPWKGGVFVTAPPDIWFLQDTNGDLKADVKEKVYTGFGTAGSQYILNNLQWGLDHKIYASVAGNGGAVSRPGVMGNVTESSATATSSASSNPPNGSVSLARQDFRFDPVTGEFESIAGGKQFGNTFDDWGDRFLCTQDTPVYQVVFPEGWLERRAHPFIPLPENPKRLVPGGERIFRISPVENWRAVRSSRRVLAQKGSPDASGVSHYVLDGVAGATVY